MFEQLFKCPDALARQRPGPLAEERLRYLVHCAEQQMSVRTLREIAIYTLTVARAPRLAGPTVAIRHRSPRTMLE
jgi:hypothetical protein